ADEDRLGRPFVGRAGKLLDKMIAAIRLSREELYIANILKSRPPGNRNPEPQEIAAHLPVLYKQMALIQPEFILCLGKVAGQTLLSSKGTLGSLRGKNHDYHGIPLLVTYHPAALLRNQRWKRPAWEDLQRLQKLYTTGLAPQ
ncbi:MAG: uracil-DNA glycosylase, partial [Rhodothermaceae bacterium]|nr:uracil-DNA glycosylase [Rhodothermaceae bacterium]